VRMKKISILGTALLCVMACTTIDLEESMVRKINEYNRAVERGEYVIVIDETSNEAEIQPEERKGSTTEDVLIVKEPIIIFENQTPYRPYSTDEIVRRSMAEAVEEPTNYIGGTQIYYYDENKQYPIKAKTLGFTIIQLEPGEEVSGRPFLSDTVRWELAGSVWRRGNVDTQLILVKPIEPGLTTNMLVITNKRLYQFVLTSNTTEYMPMVKFYYPQEQQFVTVQERREEEQRQARAREEEKRYISRNYIIRAGLFPPEWMPIDVYDDGSKTYIVLPRTVLQKEYPTIFENNNYVVNYRLKANEEHVIELDKLITKVKLRLGNRSVTIEKKPGDPVIPELMMRKPVEIVKDEKPDRVAQNETGKEEVWQTLYEQGQAEQQKKTETYERNAETAAKEETGGATIELIQPYIISNIPIPNPDWLPLSAYAKNGNLVIVFPKGVLDRGHPVLVNEMNSSVSYKIYGDELVTDQKELTLVKVAMNGSSVVIQKAE
jgi:P-type conjugative transfer protein TrbG